MVPVCVACLGRVNAAWKWTRRALEPLGADKAANVTAWRILENDRLDGGR